MQVFSRPPNDQFSFRLTRDLLKIIPPEVEYEAYYHWAGTIGQLTPFENKTFTKPNVVISLRDHLSVNGEFDFWREEVLSGSKKLISLARNNPKINFVFFVGVEQLHKEIYEPNVTIIPIGGCVVNQSDKYPTINPIINKNFNSDKLFCSLNRHERIHRITLASLLFALNLDQRGLITFLTVDRLKDREYLDISSWEFGDNNPIRDYVLSGYKKFTSTVCPTEDYLIYKTENNNYLNFIEKLSPIYQNIFVELVAETSFTETPFDVTEKFINSVYGCNFPIVIGSVGMVQHLRDVGFDMFDDIINHSYDAEINPFSRIYRAVTDNIDLLTDQHTIDIWKNNKHRFLKNVDHARENMYNFYKNRAHKQFKLIKWN